MNEMTAFASLIAGQIQRTVQAEKQAVLEPGAIGMDLYLSVHSLKDRIPADEYLRCGHVGNFRGGEQVLVAWLGNQPVIIGVF